MLLILTTNIVAPDDLYAAFLATHDSLSSTESTALNARLILILANHIGDEKVLSQALCAALPPTNRGPT